MKYLLSIILLSLASLVSATDETNNVKAHVLKISELYGDGHSQLLINSIETKKLTNSKTGYCINITSFGMEGFSGGNNYSQFIVFLKCNSNAGDSNGNLNESENKWHVIGVHPLYFHKDSLDLSTANYDEHTVSINIKTNKKTYTFTSKESIWWYRNN